MALRKLLSPTRALQLSRTHIIRYRTNKTSKSRALFSRFPPANGRHICAPYARTIARTNATQSFTRFLARYKSNSYQWKLTGTEETHESRNYYRRSFEFTFNWLCNASGLFILADCFHIFVVPGRLDRLHSREN